MWVKGHNGTQGNEESNKLAKEGAEKEIQALINLEIPKNLTYKEPNWQHLTKPQHTRE